MHNVGDTSSLGTIAISENIIFDRGRRRIYLYKPGLVVEDEIAIDFANVLEEMSVKYSVVAGYIAILFGRSRRSDDIDFIVIDMGEDGFVNLCRRLRERGFSLIQADISLENSLRETYRSYLHRGYSVRFMYRDVVIPNVEFKLAFGEYHLYSIMHSYVVVVNDKYRMRIAPLELQIAYKLWLGSEKDIGDAVFLYELFKTAIDHNELRKWCSRLDVNMEVLLS